MERPAASPIDDEHTAAAAAAPSVQNQSQNQVGQFSHLPPDDRPAPSYGSESDSSSSLPGGSDPTTMTQPTTTTPKPAPSSSHDDDKSSSKASSTSSMSSDVVESHPYKGLSYGFFTIQFMAVTLDLFMDTSVEPAWHYSITSIELVLSVLLSVYQFVRLHYLLAAGVTTNGKKRCKAATLLVISPLMQLVVVGLSAYSYAANVDWAEWTMFVVTLVWGVVSPATYSAVSDATSPPSSDGRKKGRMGPGSAMWSIFSKHFTRTPLLFFLGTIFAIGGAFLQTYQGAVINELTKAVTKVDKSTGALVATGDDVERLATSLVGVWFGANLFRFLFDVTSAKMFSALEIWLRGAVFAGACGDCCASSGCGGGGGEGVDPSVEKKATGGDNSDEKGGMSLADYQARYASDVTGVAGMYQTLLRGVAVNVILIIANFCFLVIIEWKIATVTLGFLAMGVTSGPTDLAGEAAGQVQGDVTAGLSLMGEAATTAAAAAADKDDEESPSSGEQGDKSSTTSSELIERHEREVLRPLRTHLFNRILYGNGVDSFIQFFSSFLTAVVVITMSWQVFNGDMEGSEFLGIFFVFKQLQKPAMKISGVIKKGAGKTANVERIDGLIFGDDLAGDGGGDGDARGRDDANDREVAKGS